MHLIKQNSKSWCQTFHLLIQHWFDLLSFPCCSFDFSQTLHSNCATWIKFSLFWCLKRFDEWTPAEVFPQLIIASEWKERCCFLGVMFFHLWPSLTSTPPCRIVLHRTLRALTYTDTSFRKLLLSQRSADRSRTFSAWMLKLSRVTGSCGFRDMHKGEARDLLPSDSLHRLQLQKKQSLWKVSRERSRRISRPEFGFKLTCLHVYAEYQHGFMTKTTSSVKAFLRTIASPNRELQKVSDLFCVCF